VREHTTRFDERRWIIVARAAFFRRGMGLAR
jgi:hypothetical protein